MILKEGTFYAFLQFIYWRTKYCSSGCCTESFLECIKYQGELLVWIQNILETKSITEQWTPVVKDKCVNRHKSLCFNDKI